jgi:site-specific recombinase XerD
MRSTFKVLFYLNRDKQKADGTIPLFCRITVDGQEVRFGMKCDVNPKFWDVKAGKAAGRTNGAGEINALIENTKSAIHRVYREMQEKDNYVTADKIKNIFLGIEQKHQTLLELFDSYNREKKELLGISVGKSTYHRYYITLLRLEDFIRHKYNRGDIPVKEVNRQFIDDFETYLLTRHAYSKNYILSIMKKLRHIIELALNREWIHRNPFKDYKLQFPKTDRGFLTQPEIEALMDAKFDEGYLERTRDIFVFCSFTGLSYTDVKHLTGENIQSAIDGKMWIKGKRRKTDAEYNIPLLNIPKTIIDKYAGKTSNGAILPVLSIFRYNKLLKRVAQQCGITKRMTSHLARHTFATLALTKGVSIESVSKMLGHTSISTTQIYAKITDRKIGNEMNVFAGSVKKLDAKFNAAPVEEVRLNDVLLSLKIRTGKASDSVWETLAVKMWCVMANDERQSFISEMGNKDSKPGTIRDFYIVLMDYFLGNMTFQAGNETASVDVETKQTVTIKQSISII